MDSGIRMAFFELLSEYKQAHARSWCYREKNPGGLEGPFRPIAEKFWNAYHVGPGSTDNHGVKKKPNEILYSTFDGNVRGIANYKFVITFENSARPSYVTEKIVNPKLAHSIPIYWCVCTPLRIRERRACVVCSAFVCLWTGVR